MSAQKKMIEAALAAGKSADDKPDGLVEVTLKAENTLDPNWPVTDTVMKVPLGSSVYYMLLQAYKDGKITELGARWYVDFWSHLIESINGVKNKDNKYWRFEDGEGNAFEYGVDRIPLRDGDVIKFRYVN
ncbi:PREDICTED: uncharacterized protein LOC109465178 [Branchiostoma belcheri]|uniref:Uncharacterized protein LOC109465178 n=1 Tax=Branchiostoma belcheri TaxID=7741 RepID=A0A6P4Y0D6_BRABE|nr:PREDICTED: uncharacterized protein LOC109465178 [Branchiostoma belcheri]